MSIVTNQVPTVTRSVEPRLVSVALTEFKVDEVAEYLREQGFQVDGTWSKKFLPPHSRTRSFKDHDANCDCDGPSVEGMLIDNAELDRMRTLVLCGQLAAAREYLCEIVGDYIGRSMEAPK